MQTHRSNDGNLILGPERNVIKKKEERGTKANDNETTTP